MYPNRDIHGGSVSVGGGDVDPGVITEIDLHLATHDIQIDNVQSGITVERARVDTLREYAWTQAYTATQGSLADTLVLTTMNGTVLDIEAYEALLGQHVLVDGIETVFHTLWATQIFTEYKDWTGHDVTNVYVRTTRRSFGVEACMIQSALADGTAFLTDMSGNAFTEAQYARLAGQSFVIHTAQPHMMHFGQAAAGGGIATSQPSSTGQHILTRPYVQEVMPLLIVHMIGGVDTVVTEAIRSAVDVEASTRDTAIRSSSMKFRDVSAKYTTLPGGVPNSTGPVVQRQTSLPEGDYYIRHGGTGLAFVYIVLKSLSDDGTATGADVYQTTLDEFWDVSKFPSAPHAHNTSFAIGTDIAVFQDPYITISWDAPDSLIKFVRRRALDGLATGMYSHARASSNITAPYTIGMASLNVSYSIYPAGLTGANSVLEWFITPNNPCSFPQYKVVFTVGLEYVFMRLERFMDFA